MKSHTLARLEAGWRPLAVRLPPWLALGAYSQGRRVFLGRFARQPPKHAFEPEGLQRQLWGLEFRAPLFNAAGMFKNGDGYGVTRGQGAGAYLAGTTTHTPRSGNCRRGITQPFAPYPTSGGASNWLGLPNQGHRRVAARLARLDKQPGFPIGASLATDTTGSEEQRLRELVRGLGLYQEAGVDFLEVNESCPNTEDGEQGMAALEHRLTVIAETFLERRTRPLPVIVKLSCDTEVAQVPALVDALLERGFDGVNFGNTSTAYTTHREAIQPAERRLFDTFTKNFGGGVSGRPLKHDSLALATAAVDHVRQRDPGHEFHVLRTGGVEDAEDVRKSLDAGVALCQWYTAYFEAFGRHGHDLYKELYGHLG